jgi:hypothetical protein
MLIVKVNVSTMIAVCRGFILITSRLTRNQPRTNLAPRNLRQPTVNISYIPCNYRHHDFAITPDLDVDMPGLPALIVLVAFHVVPNLKAFDFIVNIVLGHGPAHL